MKKITALFYENKNGRKPFREVVNRLLNPNHSSLTLKTLELATSVLGKKLNISIV